MRRSDSHPAFIGPPSCTVLPRSLPVLENPPVLPEIPSFVLQYPCCHEDSLFRIVLLSGEIHSEINADGTSGCAEYHGGSPLRTSLAAPNLYKDSPEFLCRLYMYGLLSGARTFHAKRYSRSRLYHTSKPAQPHTPWYASTVCSRARNPCMPLLYHYAGRNIHNTVRRQSNEALKSPRQFLLRLRSAMKREAAGRIILKLAEHRTGCFSADGAACTHTSAVAGRAWTLYCSPLIRLHCLCVAPCRGVRATSQ